MNGSAYRSDAMRSCAWDKLVSSVSKFTQCMAQEGWLQWLERCIHVCAWSLRIMRSDFGFVGWSNCGHNYVHYNVDDMEVVIVTIIIN